MAHHIVLDVTIDGVEGLEDSLIDLPPVQVYQREKREVAMRAAKRQITRWRTY